MTKKYNVALVGVTGVVGSTFVSVLNEMDLPIKNYRLFASKNSAGKKINIKGKDYVVEELTENSFDEGIDIALFSAGGEISKKFAPIAASKGVVVIDNSSAWRMNEDVPLVVPEVNASDSLKHNGIIANPNCSTIQSVVPLRPLHDKYGLKRVMYTTYQAVSGSGMAGIADLERTSKGDTPQNYPHPIYGNCLPHIDVFQDNGYTKEEMKMINETRKIIGIPNLPVTATCVRVPILNGHSVAITVELDKEFTLLDVRNLFKATKGIVVLDDVSKNEYPLATIANDTNEVYVGRIRFDESAPNTLHIWCVADNIRKGAATNTVQIAQYLMNNNL